MICPECMANQPDGTQTCGVCGHVFSLGGQAPNQGQPMQQQPYQGQPMQQQPYQGQPMQQQPYQGQPNQARNGQGQSAGRQPAKEKKSPLGAIIIAATAVVLVICGVIAVLLLGGDKKKEPKASPDTQQATATEKPAGESETKENKKESKTDETEGFFEPGDLEPDSDTHILVTTTKLTKEDVAELTASQKRYYINTLYAAHGYRFTNADWQDYFEEQDWYMVDENIEPGDQDAVSATFNETERHNLKLLQK